MDYHYHHHMSTGRVYGVTLEQRVVAWVPIVVVVVVVIVKVVVVVWEGKWMDGTNNLAVTIICGHTRA